MELSVEIILLTLGAAALLITAVAVRNRADDQPVSGDEVDVQPSFSDEVKGHMNAFGFVEQENSPVVQANIPILSASDHQYRLVGKENLVGVLDSVSKVEMKASGRVGAEGFTVSIPIMKGIRYRKFHGRVSSEKKPLITDTGRLIITDRAISFEGSQRNERITWTQIAKIDFLQDSITVSKRQGAPRRFDMDFPDPKFTAVLMVLYRRQHE